MGDVKAGAPAALLAALEALRPGAPFPHVAAAVAEQTVPSPPKPRFTEATLVAELERVGVGRPSTYSSIVQTVVARRYAEVASHPGTEVELATLEQAAGKFGAQAKTVRTATVGAYRKRLVPTAAGLGVTTYLRAHFPEARGRGVHRRRGAPARRHRHAGRTLARRRARRLGGHGAARGRRAAPRPRPAAGRRGARDPRRLRPADEEGRVRVRGRYGPVARLGEGKGAAFAGLPKGWRRPTPRSTTRSSCSRCPARSRSPRRPSRSSTGATALRGARAGHGRREAHDAHGRGGSAAPGPSRSPPRRRSSTRRPRSAGRAAAARRRGSRKRRRPAVKFVAPPQHSKRRRWCGVFACPRCNIRTGSRSFWVPGRRQSQSKKRPPVCRHARRTGARSVTA